MKEELLYEPNSHKYKEEQKKKQVSEEKKVEKVVSGKVKTKKKSEIKKFTDLFISEDANSVWNYIVSDILVPSIKKTISDIVTNGIDILLNGEPSQKRKSSGSKVSYRSYYDSQNDYRSNISTKSRFDYDDIVFETRGDAERTLDLMQEIIDQYDFVSVADLYDMVDLVAPHTANRYGWTSIRNACVIRETGGGYVIKLPRAKVID